MTTPTATEARRTETLTLIRESINGDHNLKTTPDETFHRLATGLADIPTRDMAMRYFDDARLPRARQLWELASTRCRETGYTGYTTPLDTLTAWTCWNQGNERMALRAVYAALSINPNYKMALHLLAYLDSRSQRDHDHLHAMRQAVILGGALHDLKTPGI